MPNPKLETYKNKATNTVYDLTDADAQSKLTAILDGTDIDSFGDVESALADKVSKSATAGLLKNDGTVDTTQYVSDISGKVDFADIAPAFSASTNYTIGQLVTYNGNLYRFIYDHSAGAWNDNDVAQTTIRQDLEHKEDSVTYNSDDFEHVIVIDDGEPYATNMVSLNRSNIFPRDEQRVLGAKNLLNNTATTQTINGVTYTVNAIKTVSLSNTAIANSRLIVGSFTAKAGETYILTGAPNSADTSNYLGLYLHGDTHSVATDTGNGVVITTDTDTLYDVGIRIKSGKDTSDMVFKPMIRLATDPDDTYVPYAMTNKELTSAVAESVKEGDTNSLFRYGNMRVLNMRGGTMANAITLVADDLPSRSNNQRGVMFDNTTGKVIIGSINSSGLQFVNTSPWEVISATTDTVHGELIYFV